ncbi:glutamate--cysteine ligase [Streptomyces sp. HNM0663]|uniref:Putative glutamate--cysteine ligase 2 n=1 Tax=Streptomyces chengmaiensis TaxID=3040919 RepID=A0ABT6HVF0_9ACTN|nr:glutamate--cysteine ligase [Streptomyces chengmaiensis]MDH2392698.1 glutamate--cysteine ligase [Streptomyces chengmaiensis]
MRSDELLTVGLEEEYLIVDPVSRAVRPCAESVIASAAKELGEDRVGDELTRFHIEARTTPCATMRQLGNQIREMRAVAAGAAAAHGLAVVSSGSPVLGDIVPPPLTPGARYARNLEIFRGLNDDQGTAGCHVHIGLADRRLAIEVSNRLRPWLPVLVALGANSPFWAGRYTGYASWRTLIWARWPVSGPPPHFESVGHFEELVGRLLAGGAVMDRQGLYWDVRPSVHVPTLEVRTADALMSARDTVLYASLVRALVATALRETERGEPVPNPAPEVVRAAYWRAARDGLRGQALDVRTDRLVPAADLADRLYAYVRPALERSGDREQADVAWEWLRGNGAGAERQRAAHRRRSSLSDVVDCLIGAVADPVDAQA